MRLFVAVPVPAAARDRLLAAVTPRYDDERLAWTQPDGWHVTLAFLGEVADGMVGDVAAAVAVGCEHAGVSPPLRLTTGSVTTLGRGALALAVTDHPDGALAALGATIQSALSDAGLPVQRRAVRPHLTLGRARRRQSVPADVRAGLTVPATAWDVTDVAVVRSVLGRGPATYETVETVALAGSGSSSTDGAASSSGAD